MSDKYDIEYHIERNIDIANEAYDMAKGMTRLVMTDTIENRGHDETLDIALQMGSAVSNKRLHVACAAIARVIAGIAMTARREGGIDPRVTVSCITVMASVVVEQLLRDEAEGPKH